MLTEWTIGNFKSIDKKTTLTLAPLTMICGANSSGKSTILQSILAVAQTFSSGTRTRGLILNGQLTRLGDFSELLHAGSEPVQEMEIGFKLDFPESLIEQVLLDISVVSLQKIKSNIHQDLPVVKDYKLGFRWHSVGSETKRYSNLDLKHNIDPPEGAFYYEIDLLENLENEQPYLEDDKFTHATLAGLLPTQLLMQYNKVIRREAKDLDLLTSIVFDPKTSKLDKIVKNQPVPGICLQMLEKVADEDLSYTEQLKILVDLGDRLELTWHNLAAAIEKQDLGKIIPRHLRQRYSGKNWSFNDGQIKDLSRRLKGLEQEWVDESKKKATPEYDVEPRHLPSTLQKAVDQMKSFWLTHFAYLGPLRDDPKVIFAAPTDIERRNVGIKGEYTAAVLSEFGESEEIEYPLPPQKQGLTLKTTEGTLSEAVIVWLKHMGLVDGVNAKERAKIGYELTVQSVGLRKQLDLMNVGVGVSQVLPTLVMSLMAPKGSLLIFEQPELHLHPKVQSILGDFFISIAEMGKQCLLETHSERIINRVRRRIAEAPDDSVMRLNQIYFVEKEQIATRIITVEPNEYGAIPDWPKGFFDEGPDEAQQIIQAAMKKRQAKRRRPTRRKKAKK